MAPFRGIALLSLSLLALPSFNAVVGGHRWHEVAAGESVVSLSARFGVEPATLTTDNALPADARLRRGQRLLIDNRHIVPRQADDGVIINVPQRILFVVQGGEVRAAFPVAVGRPDWPTPVGTFRIHKKEVDPTWDVPLSIQREMAQAGREVLTRVPPGPGNPLGAHWLGLTGTACGIHGTNRPASIYRFTTHGCIRLHPDDIAVVFAMVDVGTAVRIVYEPVLVTRSEGGEILIEVHRDIYKRTADRLRIARELLREVDETLAYSTVVGDAVSAAAGRIVRLPPELPETEPSTVRNR